MLEPWRGVMNQRFSDSRLKSERPIWCDHCRIRIAPYEDVRLVSARAFHKHCFRKAEITESAERDSDQPALDIAIA
jgi:hypothetical protein